MPKDEQLSPQKYRNKLVATLVVLLTPISLLPFLGVAALLVFHPKISLLTGLSSPYTSIILLAAAAGLLLSSILTALVIHIYLAPLRMIADAIQKLGEGELQQRIGTYREDETGWLAYNFNQAAANLSATHRQIEDRLAHYKRGTEMMGNLAGLSSSAPSLSGYLSLAVNLLTQFFGFYNAAIFLLDEGGQQVVLQASSSYPIDEAEPRQSIPLGSKTMVGWAAAQKQLRISQAVQDDPYFQPDTLLKHTRSEAVFPLLVGQVLLGVLSIKSDENDVFSDELIEIFQHIAAQLSVGVQIQYLKEATELNPAEYSLLNLAIHQVAGSGSEDEVLEVLSTVFSQISYQTIVLLKKEGRLKITWGYNPQQPELTIPANLPHIDIREVSDMLPTGRPLLVRDFDNPPQMPDLLLGTLAAWNCSSAAFIPVYRKDDISALFVLGSLSPEEISLQAIQPYRNLAEITATTVEKLQAYQELQDRQIELETLINISQVVGGQTELQTVFAAVHEAINQVIGPVEFLVAIYDQRTGLIHIPYIYEEGKILVVEPFPLGQGLTSILLNTREPLLLVEDTARRALELGAKLVGKAPKSWLGVPLFHQGEVLGAIIVQDLEQENRFNNNHLRVLAAASSPVAAAIRNAQLLEKFHSQSERERRLHQAARKIHGSIDIQTILATTTTELAKSLGAQRATIELTSLSHRSHKASHGISPFPPTEDPGASEL